MSLPITTKVKIPKAFSPLFKKYRYKVFYSGRGAGKSHAFATALLILGTQSTLRILCVREFQSSIRDSVKSLLDDKIKEMDLKEFYESTRDAIVGLNGTLFVFAGLKTNVSKIKSLEGIDICWCEEAQTISQESFNILIPTIRQEESEIWASWNPMKETDPIYKMFVVDDRPDACVRKVSWRDNPFFPEVLKKEMEYDKGRDTDKYLHVWEGEVLRISEAAVFKGKFSIDRFEAPENTSFYIGCDFGFASDPLAIIRCYIDQDNRKLFIDKGNSAVGVEIDDTPAFLEAVIPDIKKWIITADSARPEIISFLRRKNFRIQASKKGAGSVLEGIEYLKNFDIIVHESLKGVIHELSTYSYKVDKLTGQIQPILEDKDNHFVDALRYATESCRRPKATIVV